MTHFRRRLGAGSLSSLLLLAACNPQPSAQQTAAQAPAATDSTRTTSAAMPTSASFGKTTDGTEVRLFTLANAHGMQVTISTLGGTITGIRVPDRNGKIGDVVLGFDEASGYQSPAFLKSGPYFGALIGRYGNRIKGGQFALGGHAYTLAKNNGPNALHGGKKGFDKMIWDATPGRSAAGQTLTLHLLSKDGEEGYPGNLAVTVAYTLTDDSALRIDYTATTDQPTVLNLTNHAYFNLNHGASKDVLAHVVTLPADRYTVVDATLIPTGELRPVKGTPFDFTAPHAIGERIGQVPGGYDHNWVLNAAPGPHPAATVYDPASGRTLEVSTDQPGVQFYTGNFLDGSLKGHGGTVYGQHAGFCLETQHFPDSPNQPKFPSTVLKPGETYRTTSEYKFGVRK